MFFGGSKKHQNVRGFLRGFFGTPGALGGIREGSLRPKRPLGMALWHGSGMQAKGPARPGSESGRIVCALRHPPRPVVGLQGKWLWCSVGYSSENIHIMLFTVRLLRDGTSAHSLERIDECYVNGVC